MLNGHLKALVPHLIAAAVLLIIAGAYYSPSLSGKVLNQSDNVQALGMQREINEVRKETGEHPLWTNTMFGGMPVYQVHLPQGNNYTSYIAKIFFLGGNMFSQFRIMFVMMIMFYILMVAMGVDWRIGLIGAIAYGMATNHVVLTEAGHTTKLITMAYLPPTLAGVILAFRGKYLAGFVMTALFLSLQILANHIQVTYYFFLALFFYGVFEFFKSLKAKELPHFAKAVAVLVVAGLIGIGTNTARLWTTYEYVDETIRGQSELVESGQYSQGSSTNKEGEGLSKDYIFGWSYGISETFTVLVPDYMGRASGNLVVDGKGQLRKDTESALAFQREVNPKLQQAGADAQQLQQQVIRAANPFRGDVPFTSGPIYFGAIICFLFVLGLILVQGPMKWWLLTATILMAMLGWGRNFGALNFFLYEHFPMFNKFRAVMMALGVGQLFVTVLAILGLKELVFNSDIAKTAKSKAVLMAGGITGGLCLLLYLGGAMGFINFASPKDPEILSQFPQFMSAIYADRAAMLQSDALRSFMFILGAAAALWVMATERLKWSYAVIIVGVLVLVDFWGVDRRFIKNEDFKTKLQQSAQVQARPVDLTIQKDPELHYRVWDLSGFGGQDPFRSAFPSYFHNSMGGYHAAKLMRFQDLCEHYLFNMNPTANQNILGMFNTKYFIMTDPQTQQPRVYTNPSAAGSSWFVRDYEIVENADAEMKALGTLDPRFKAVIDKKHASYLEGLVMDSTITAGDNITMTSYSPDKMVYNVKASKERLAMFGEIYYPPSKGWNLYVDGKKQDLAFIKANYAIRAARIPAGEYQVEMRFEPKSFYTGKTIALICSLLVFLALGYFLFLSYKDFDLEKFEAKEAAKAAAVAIAPKKETKKSSRSEGNRRQAPKKKRK
jgi:hypothetical protein